MRSRMVMKAAPIELVNLIYDRNYPSDQAVRHASRLYRKVNRFVALLRLRPALSLFERGAVGPRAIEDEARGGIRVDYLGGWPVVLP